MLFIIYKIKPKNKPIIKPSSVAELQKRRQNLLNQNDTHDQLMAEFRKVHRKLFTSSNEETEEEEDQDENEDKE